MLIDQSATVDIVSLGFAKKRIFQTWTKVMMYYKSYMACFKIGKILLQNQYSVFS